MLLTMKGAGLKGDTRFSLTSRCGGRRQSTDAVTPQTRKASGGTADPVWAFHSPYGAPTPSLKAENRLRRPRLNREMHWTEQLVHVVCLTRRSAKRIRALDKPGWGAGDRRRRHGYPHVTSPTRDQVLHLLSARLTGPGRFSKPLWRRRGGTWKTDQHLTASRAIPARSALTSGQRIPNIYFTACAYM